MSVGNGGSRKNNGLVSVALHSMPSANAENPIIVHTPHDHRLLYGFARLFTFLTAIVLILLISGVFLLESGVVNGALASRAQTLLQNTVGGRFVATVGGANVRFAKGGRLALVAREVDLRAGVDGQEAVRAKAVIIALKVLPLLSGSLKISHVEIDGGFIVANAIGKQAQSRESDSESQNALNVSSLKVTDLELLTDRGFLAIHDLSRALRLRGTRRIILRDVLIEGIGHSVASENEGFTGYTVNVESAEIAEMNAAGFEIEAAIQFADQNIKFDGKASIKPGTNKRMQMIAHLTGVHLGKMIRTFTDNPNRKFRLESLARVEFQALEGQGEEPAQLKANLQLSSGELFMDGIAAQLEQSTIRLALDTKRKSLEFRPSRLKIGKSSYSFNGGIIDLSNYQSESQDGFAIDLLVDKAIIAPTDSIEPPVTVAMKAFARFIKSERRFYVDEFIVSGQGGTMFSSASIQLTDTSPEVSFVANVNTMQTTAIKQLWPYWIAKRARAWVQENLFGGTVTGGAIRVFIPGGRMAEGMPGGLHLDENQLQVDFNIEDARFDIAGDIPPVRDATGLLSLRGQHLELQINRGSAYFPTGRSVAVSDGTFTIESTDAKPLMAHLTIAMEGDASAVAELISYQPINALERTPYTPEDFSGTVRSQVELTFGLVKRQQPPRPEWNVELNLDGVSLGPKVNGVKVTNAQGKMFVDTQAMRIDADAELNGMQSHLNFIDPIDSQKGVEPFREVKMYVSDDDRAQFAPQLNEYIKGTIHLTTILQRDGRQEIDADLTNAELLLPWIGWSKGKGVKGSARFEVIPQGGSADGNSDPGLPQNMLIKNLNLRGEGFSALGSLQVSGGGVTSAKFSRASLSRNDDFSVNMTRKGNSYLVNVGGEAIDLRSTIKQLLKDSGDDEGKPRVDLNVNTKRAFGFNNESMQGLKLAYSGVGSNILKLNLTAKTDRGRAIAAKGTHDGSGLVLTFTSTDAGAVARFVDIYDKIDGGQLAVQLVRAGNGPYIGSIDMREFSIVNDENLKSLVSSKADGSESLNQAVRRDIDVSRAQFQNAYARVEMGKGYLRVTDGIARGPLVGFAFQGTVFDENDNMNVTGTFMPAYGLNRILAEIPVLGVLLGNGRDRGLIGITFRLSGRRDEPQLVINPISIIAPGIFRSIFQFRDENRTEPAPRTHDPNEGGK
ncbi:MAG: DUF3971 domain-containing protein [Rhizobiaceae bacterium]|nr:DUF3971 domain-containing protein [Rhizobiaceae bacterium]